MPQGEDYKGHAKACRALAVRMTQPDDHKRTSQHVQSMSALPPKADILRCSRDVDLLGDLVANGE
jgi:hypothetical protein